LADNAGGKFAINATTGVVTVAGAIDYEASQNQSIIVKESDAGGLSTTQTFTIGVTNVNEAPTNLVDSNTAANSVAQSAAIGTVVGITAKATDPDAGTLTYSLTDNAVGKFAIDATTGVVKVAGALDNTPSHKITVEAKDAGGLVTTQTFTIGVTDIHQTPTNPNAPTNLVDGNAVVNSVKEDATIGATVGITASATAPGALTYSLTDNADGKFAINASTGVVSVAGVLDYETASSHNITVKATDAANQSTSQMFTIGLTNVNEAPTDVVDGDVVVNAIDKKAEIGTSVGIAAQAIDPDADDTFTYSLTTNPNNLFAIDAKTGEVTLAGPLDDVTSYTITVTATDAEGLTIVHDFVIVVTEDVEDESIELIGTIGNDTLLGARNSDVLSGNMGADVLTGDAGNDALQGNQGADEVYGGEGEDTVLGGKGTDRMNGNTGDDTLNGNLANDIVHGGQGNDLVYGGQGDDTVFGDLGNDTVSGDMGRDYLMGGEGNDVFVFFNGSSTIDASDAIGDFKAGEDKIDLKAFGYTNVVVVSASSSTVVHDAYTLVLQARTTEDGGMFLSNSDLNLGIKLQGTEEINTTDFLL
jgi:Ca2+-binding RTX toxin-like protein